MNGEALCIKYLGRAFIIFIICSAICILASLGYNTKIDFHDNNKKIEVNAEHSNLIKPIE